MLIGTIFETPDFQTVSVELASGEWFGLGDGVQDLGIGNAWSIVTVMKTDDNASDHYMYRMIPASGSNNHIRAKLENTGTSYHVWIHDSSGATIKEWRSNNRWNATDTWRFHVLTWDGTDLILYQEDVKEFMEQIKKK